MDDRFSLHPSTLESCEWREYRLVMPTISVGQVGQLAIDLLLNNLHNKLRRIGIIYSDAVLPVSGVDRSGSHLCASLELYECTEHKLVILQQRAPFVKGRVPSFRRRLVEWVKRVGFVETIVFAGVSAHIRKDEELQCNDIPFRFITTDPQIREKLVTEHQWKEYGSSKPQDETSTTTTTTATFEVPGSGILKSLYEDCVEADVCLCAYIMFCNPGNTVYEAMKLIEHFNTLVGTSGGVGAMRREMKTPASWNMPSDDIKSSYIF